MEHFDEHYKRGKKLSPTLSSSGQDSLVLHFSDDLVLDVGLATKVARGLADVAMAVLTSPDES